MIDDDEERRGRPDGHRYQAPDSDETRKNREWNYIALGLLVVVLMVLIATGTVQIFPGG
jgi:hypothetical protein